MSCTIKDIYALRDPSRTIVIPPSIMSAIEIVHHSIEKNGTSSGNKQVEWRNNKQRGGPAKPYKKTFSAADAAGTPQK
jgi:hypothetical protein